ncbi:tetratricopeptide repeat protein [Bradyrhizobium erythrophlei]|uniref:tetratricopeptide repeat protein n=1 Tax=Bradyrhizobium erythrophlei TaxID=1437360 RepID=UPI0035F06F6E
MTLFPQPANRDSMKAREMKVRRRLCYFRPDSCPALVALLAILQLGGCASLDHSGLSLQETPRPALLDAKDINPAMRDRIAHALGGDVDEDTLRAALKNQPSNIDAAIPLARTLLARKRSDEALEVLDNVLLAVPGDVRALNAKGVVLDNEGRHDEAQALYRQALATDPGNPMLRNNLNLSLAIDGKAETGKTSLQPLLKERHGMARSQ